MAKTFTASTSGAREVVPALVCLFLDALPPELRQLIYEMAFHGSRVHASLFDFMKPRPLTPALILRHSSHFNVLLSCRKVYNEALDTFWSVTVLEFAQPLERSKMLQGPEMDAQDAGDSYTHHLCSSLPKALKMKIRHIRGLILPRVYGTFAEIHPSFTATALLSDFKNLATCDISPTWRNRPEFDFQSKPIENMEFNDFTQFTTTWGKQPGEYLAARYGINTAAKIVFLMKTLVKIPSSEKDEEQVLDNGFYRAVR